jgi:hypothetical protein
MTDVQTSEVGSNLYQWTWDQEILMLIYIQRINNFGKIILVKKTKIRMWSAAEC